VTWLQPTLSKFDNISLHFSKVRGFSDEGKALLSLYADFAFFVHQHYERSSRRRKRVKDHHDSDVERQRPGDHKHIPASKKARPLSSAVINNDAARRFFKGIDSAIRASV